MEQPLQESQRQRCELAYVFFLRAEQTGHCFTPEELAEVTGYTIGTTKIYLAKKWWWFTKKNQAGYLVQGLAEYPLADFLQDLSQKAKEPVPDLPSPASTTDFSWRQEPLSLSLALTIISLCIFWAVVLLFLRKRSWWLIPV